jgi:hypothetical protein
MISRISERVAGLVEPWLSLKVPETERVEWDVMVTSEPKGDGDKGTVWIDHFVCVWLQWNELDNDYCIETRFSIPLSIATDDEVIERLGLAWDQITVERMASELE